MRIPHHLTRSATGLWSFRQRVPVDLHAVLRRRIIKRSLRTHDLRHAQAQALALMARYAHAFAMARDLPMDRISKKDVDALIEGLTKSANRQDLTVLRTKAADGTIEERWQIDNDNDLRLFQQLQRSSGSIDPLQDAVDGIAPYQRPAPAPPAPAIAAINLADARDAWLATLKASTLPKTWTIKKTAVEALTRFLGEKTKLHTVTRTDLARWYQHMREAGASTPTLTNKQSYIGGKGGFFDWAQASGHFPRGDNPASGHVTYSTREKRSRRKHGFKAYDTQQVQALFAPAALEGLPLAARWASLIGLYTGARASEVGQLLIVDVVHDEHLPCIRISDEGEHQKVKTEVSLRTVPVHPHLIELGFLDWVRGQRDAGHDRLFPAAKASAKNGQGNWITKAFGRHLEGVAKHWPKAKRGFHSLRKTVIQNLQGSGVASELRAQLVGHELDDEHHTTYSREFTVREKLEGIGAHSPGLAALAYGLNLPALRPLLSLDASAPRPGRKSKNLPPARMP